VVGKLDRKRPLGRPMGGHQDGSSRNMMGEYKLASLGSG